MSTARNIRKKSPVVAPIRVASLREQIAGVLEREIISGKYGPGERMVERSLARQFGVSSIPIREALHDLENRGLVIKRHNYGCSVVALNPEDAGRLCDLRRVLEPEVMRWAAQRMNKQGVAILQRELAAMQVAAEHGDHAEFFHCDWRFHAAIWDISGNRFAAKALHAAIGSLFASGVIRGKQSGQLNLPLEVKKHAKLLKALASGNGDGAAATLLEIAKSFERHLPAAQQPPQ
ncbi:MAG: GntR family transcriptional regulator [Bryobacterales bacterium]|nr:GntR family transcriptional regulator [Bryobacterales bacterium]